jgi:hypothetical protein
MFVGGGSRNPRRTASAVSRLREGAGSDADPSEPVVHAGAGHFGGGGKLVDGFACLVPADQLLVGQTHPPILPSGSVSPDGNRRLGALETEVLDALDAADDAEAPSGTRPLSAARRRAEPG